MLVHFFFLCICGSQLKMPGPHTFPEDSWEIGLRVLSKYGYFWKLLKCFWCAARFGNLWLTPFPLTTQQMPSSLSFLASASWMKLNYSNFTILWTLSLGIIHIEGALKFESGLYADTHLSDLERHHFEPLLFLSTFRLFENRIIKNSVLGIVFPDKGISLVLFSAFLWMGPLLEILQEVEQCCSWESMDSRVRIRSFLSGLQVLGKW